MQEIIFIPGKEKNTTDKFENQRRGMWRIHLQIWNIFKVTVELRICALGVCRLNYVSHGQFMFYSCEHPNERQRFSKAWYKI